MSKRNRPLSQIRLLVVDDEPDSLEITTFMLEQAGFTVEAASSGDAALERLKTSVPDLVVSDIGMPGMDGYTLMSKIRALPAESGGEVSAIALTAYASELDSKRSTAVGFQRHVAKPIDPDRLLQVVDELLSI